MIVAVMGVSGSGKTTVAKGVAERLGWVFQEGDALHPPENVAKMKAGHPLDDADRIPWLHRVADWVDARRAAGESGIVTCSLLKRSYREIVIGARPNVRLMYLHGAKPLIADHVAHRTGHFMPPSLLDSQFATLEEPTPDEHPMIVEITDSAEEAIEKAVFLVCRDS